ncbi:hypothetical protein DdX_03213 [Ditylenchus destructor]|uniref:Uncharacterized protein n=1 Tax=Ditylenchus destructor TaxID=166010 RepID=A0AAD4NG77_9BILA|nr:hypothetical protein DdX_03213 [Ditylenchus destructor]
MSKNHSTDYNTDVLWKPPTRMRKNSADPLENENLSESPTRRRFSISEMFGFGSRSTGQPQMERQSSVSSETETQEQKVNDFIKRQAHVISTGLDD